jgi:glucokinase
VVTIGTGIAAALVIDGEVVPGSNNRAGELGQIRVADLNGKATSPLESVASAQALAQRYEKAMSRPPGSFTAPDVIRAATNGDPIAGAVWSDVRARLADVIAAAVCVFDPSVVVIGGGLARAGRALFEPLRADIAQRMPWRSPPDLVRARFLDESGWIGAAILAWRAAGEDADPAGWLDGWAPA